MLSKTLTIENSEGLHMRPAGVVAKEMGKFVCDVTIVFGDKRINAKSIMGMMSMSFENGSELTIVADGADEEAAVNALSEYLTKNNK